MCVQQISLAWPRAVSLLCASVHVIKKRGKFYVEFAYAYGGMVTTLIHVFGGLQCDALALILRAGPILCRVRLSNVDEVKRNIILVFRIKSVERAGSSSEIW